MSVLNWKVSWFGSPLDLENINHDNESNIMSQYFLHCLKTSIRMYGDTEGLKSEAQFYGIVEAPVSLCDSLLIYKNPQNYNEK